METLKKNYKSLRCGLHSGFPLCCIAFYMLFWQWLHYKNWFGRFLHKLFFSKYWNFIHYHDRYNNSYARGAGYIQCPLCSMSGYSVVVKECSAIYPCKLTGKPVETFIDTGTWTF
jgi:hypothetical protein